MRSPKQYIERDLWEKVFSGDKKAIEELIKQFDPVIRSQSRVNGKVDEDVAQEIREKLFIEIKKIIQRETEKRG